MTRVVHVHRIAGVGGSERHLLTLLPALRERGVDAAFAGLDADGADPFYAELDRLGVPYERIHRPWELPGALRRLRAELVHTHLVHADVYGALAAGARPLVSTKHNDDPFRTGPFRLVERAITRRARRVVAITEALARFCVERVGLPRSKVTVVHYGLDELPPAWGPNPPLALPVGAPVLLAVARLVPQKGIDVAVRALAELRREHPEAVLVVAGEGPERARLEALAAQQGVASALRLPGRAGDVAAWLRRADLLVHPVRWEGFGLVVLEAMLAGLPVVASRVSSLPELVEDGRTGVLVPPDDPAALAAAAGSLLADAPRRRAYGAAGLERARERFSVAQMAERTLALY